MVEEEQGRHRKQQAGTVFCSDSDELVGWTKRQTMVVLAVGIAFSLGVIFEWGPINGIPGMTNWEWPWRNLGIFKTALALLVPFAAVSWVLWRIEKSVSRFRVWFLLGVLVLSNFSLQVAGVLVDPRGFGLVQKIVVSPKATSYFTDALEIQRLPEWLGTFHQHHLHNHSATHPPGPVLFYYLFVKLFGPSLGALVGGCAVGLAGSLGVLVMYSFAGLWTQDQRTRLLASAFYSLVPALIVFFPAFDQVYPIFAMLMILFWMKALSGSPRHACYLGVLLFTIVFFVYNLLAAGAFLAYYALYWLWREGGRRSAYATLLATSGIALGVCVGLYLMLWSATGYNPISSLRGALINQEGFAAYLHRSYIRCAIYDPYDFAMGAGVIALVILVFYIQRNYVLFEAKRTDIALTLIALGTILTIDLSGLLRAETARVWLFLQPLLVVPVSLELSRLRWPWLLAMFILQWWIVVCLKAKMSFILPLP